MSLGPAGSILLSPFLPIFSSSSKTQTMSKHLFVIALFLSSFAVPLLHASEPTNDRAPFQDEFLEKLAGRWNLTRTVRGTAHENTVEADWVLDHQFLRIHMKDMATPPKYEAEVYIGYDETAKRYVAHWMDTYGGRFSLMGYGVREGNSLPFTFEDADATVRNTFTYDPTNQTWTCLIVQKVKDGDWKTFAEDKLKRP
jgi:hypothetical protein